MNYQAIFVGVGTSLTLLSIIPYLKDTVTRKSKPRIVSWLNWSLLTAIAGAAALADHQYPAAILSFASASATTSVAILGYHYGDRSFDKTDALCQIGALVGLVLWLVFNSPAIAVLATVSIDFVAAIPTIKHSWQKPHEETLITYSATVVGCVFILLAIREVSFTALTYPIYLFSANLLLAVIITVRRNKSPT